MDTLAQKIVWIISASSLQETTARALDLLYEMTCPVWACLLVWDAELGRYIIGAVRLSDEADEQPSDVRRCSLRIGLEAYQADDTQPRLLRDSILYHPINAGGYHVGAVCCRMLNGQTPPNSEAYHLLLQTTARALYTNARLDQADREHAELLADRERLSGLLAAVEQQQRTIDQLLVLERQFSAELEAKVEERTAELRETQSHLIQSEKLAVIGKLASSLAHELNNPLQAIQSGLGLVLSELEAGHSEHVTSDLRIMQEELERIQSIFRQMLDFYRPVSYENAPLDLNAICDGVRVLMRKRLQEARVTLRLQLADDLPLVCGDTNQIKQVLINLILNAADALHDTGGNIALQTHVRDGKVELMVIDDGPGIAEEYLAQLFEPLFTTKTRGLGLGLAISQEIAQRHNGSIHARSEPGKGTTFTVHLPVRSDCHE